MPISRRRLVLSVAAAAAVVAAGATSFALIDHGAAPKRPTPSGMADSFNRSNRNISGDKSPFGTRYSVDYDPAKVDLEIVDHKLVRGQRGTSGPKAAPILLLHNPTVPSTVSVRWVFTSGQTLGENVVVGTCARGFGFGSVQLAVTPQSWDLFYIWRPRRNKVDIVEIEKHILPSRLKTDGRTVYAASMTVDLHNSSVLITYPGGESLVRNPAIAKYWGTLMGVQMRRPNPTDGDTAIVEISDRLMNSSQ